ncbi:DUF2851 family protein [Marixanthomonas spongiae]|uniref:DUF2851 domain-containing protein n=1 Tax=Marixanthomonas spongiae TaxID=2174845 RepID=A0A2U0I5M0_9FLAO|nr:DUF2851 family protein [Marixanthomonas spongiae]PVW16310.1 DUF2851 domain-containing protein [Marixanthomonas spongiae]
MKEDFLHYAWKFQKFTTTQLKTSEGQTVKVLSVGQHNHDAGPDFFNAKVSIGEQMWAGNVEIHLKSSDWYAHHHEKDPAYDSVILHVVWEHDAAVFAKDNSAIPTVEVKNILNTATLDSYRKLFSKKQRWIACEQEFPNVEAFTIHNWLENLYFERLQQKSQLILKELKASNNHWEAVLFNLLAKNFGLKVNGAAFYSMAQSLDFSVVKKCAEKPQELEALFLGQAGLLNETNEDGYFQDLQDKYGYLSTKFKLSNADVVAPKYFRLRPPNFPTIRLSQLAMLYAGQKHLLSKIISTHNKEAFYEIFSVTASEYWNTHYNFGVVSTKRKRKLTTAFIDLLLINTVIPLKFCYANAVKKDISEELIQLASSIDKEDNSIIKKFNQLKPIAETALHSQGLLQLKKEYCDKVRCLQCAVGNAVLGKKRE